ncbi:putative methyltransferase, chloroplastic [Capsicum galapagoense]
MATCSVSLNQHGVLIPIQLKEFTLNSRISVPTRFSSNGFPSRITATSAVAVEQELRTPVQDATEDKLFACPICYEPLIRKGPSGFNVPAIYRSGFKCRKCNKSYSSKNLYLDLTVTSGTKEYNESKPTRTELFRSPVVSFLYERGWRQAFNQSGFPGADEEFNMAQEYFKVAEGGVLVDVSCGSGLFSRKFAKSGVYSRVIALDFSENMLRQCYDFVKADESVLSSNLALVRADVSRLPFFSGSVDAVHAGAALHCWPSPSNAIAEINRILRSGGVFVGTTFLRVNPSTAPAILRALGQSALRTTYTFFTQEEIEDLVTTCGFVNYTSKVQGSFIMFSAQKR